MEDEIQHLRRQRDELHAANNRSLEEIRNLRIRLDAERRISNCFCENMIWYDHSGMVQDFMRWFLQPMGGFAHLPECSEAEQRAFVAYANALDGHKNIPADTLRGLRVKMRIEEFQEELIAESRNDLVGIADAIVDGLYIAHGTALTYGIPINEVFAAVHESNMAKLGPDGKPIVREDGKVIKPEGWKAPDIAAILRKHGWEGNGNG